MRIKFVITLAFLFISLTNLAQTDLPQVIPPSPNTASLGKYGEIPIGLFTGSPQIGIPLVQLSTRNLSVPVTLRYSSNGVRVDEYASNVGMGWDLSAGGVITRRVNDDPDENQQVAMPDVYTQLNTPAMANYLEYSSTQNGEAGSVDSNADIFSFSFNGFSGKFYLDSNSTNILNRTPIFLEPSPIKVEVLTALGNSSETGTGDFKITDPNGIVYYFGGTNAVEKSMSRSSCATLPPGADPNYKIENAWHLRKIVHPNGDIINFVYQLKTSYYDNGVSQNVTRSASITPSGSCSATSDTPCLYGSLNIVSYLTEVNSNNSAGKITFSYSQKTGMPANMDKLDKISMYDKNNSLLKEQVFDYQSYISSSGPSVTIPSQLHQTYHRKRFFLDKVTEKSSTGVLKPPHTFEYNNPEQLPSRFSFSQDYWGYYNGKSNVNLIDTKTVQLAGVNPVVANGLQGFIPANRDPNFFYGIKGILKKVTYPTGGHNKLYYDPHSYAGSTTVLPAITKKTATVFNPTTSGSTTYTDQFTTSTIPFNQDADFQFIVDMDELLGGSGGGGGPGEGGPGGGGGGTTSPLTFQVEIRNAANNQLSYIYEKISGLEYARPNPYTVTTSNFNKDYYARLEAGKAYKVKVFVSRPQTTGTAKLYYYATNGTTTSTNIEVGGLRVAKLETSDGDGDLQTKNYHYGTLNDLTESSGIVVNRNSDPTVMENRVYYQEEPGTGDCHIATLSSNSAFPIYGVNHIGYSSVIEEYGTNFSGGGTKSVFNTTIIGTPNLMILGNYIPNTPRSSAAFTFGQELEKSIFKKTGSNYKTLSKVESFYKHDPQLDTEFETFNIRQAGSITGPNAGGYLFRISLFDITRHILLRQWRYLEKTVKTQYDEDGLNPVATTTEYFYDNPDHLQVTRTKTTVSDNDPILTKTFYPDDVLTTVSMGNDALSSNEISAIAQLKKNQQHRVAKPIQVSTYKDINDDGVGDLGEQLSVQRTNYNNSGDFLPKEVQTLKGVYNYSTNKLLDRLQFHSYYANGNVKEVSKKDGSHIVYIWGYNEQYPIAKIENATYAEVSSQVANLQNKSNADNDHTIGTAGNEGALRAALTTLRNTAALSDALVTTFTYDPQKGVTSVTDPTGQIVYYHYDSFNRLEMVTDKDNKVLSKNEYHYKN